MITILGGAFSIEYFDRLLDLWHSNFFLWQYLKNNANQMKWTIRKPQFDLIVCDSHSQRCSSINLEKNYRAKFLDMDNTDLNCNPEMVHQPKFSQIQFTYGHSFKGSTWVSAESCYVECYIWYWKIKWQITCNFCHTLSVNNFF